MFTSCVPGMPARQTARAAVRLNTDNGYVAYFTKPSLSTGPNADRNKFEKLGKIISKGVARGSFTMGNLPSQLTQNQSLWLKNNTTLSIPSVVTPSRFSQSIPTFSGHYDHLLRRLTEQTETPNPLFSNYGNGAYMEGLHKQYSQVPEETRGRFLHILKEAAPQVHQAFVEWLIIHAGASVNNGLSDSTRRELSDTKKNVARASSPSERAKLTKAFIINLQRDHSPQFEFIKNVAEVAKREFDRSGNSQKRLNELCKSLDQWVGPDMARVMIENYDHVFTNAKVADPQKLDISSLFPSRVNASDILDPTGSIVTQLKSQLIFKSVQETQCTEATRDLLACVSESNKSLAKDILAQLVRPFIDEDTSFTFKLNPIRGAKSQLAELATNWNDSAPMFAQILRDLVQHRNFDSADILRIKRPADRSGDNPSAASDVMGADNVARFLVERGSSEASIDGHDRGRDDDTSTGSDLFPEEYGSGVVGGGAVGGFGRGESGRGRSRSSSISSGSSSNHDELLFAGVRSGTNELGYLELLTGPNDRADSGYGRSNPSETSRFFDPGEEDSDSSSLSSSDSGEAVNVHRPLVSVAGSGSGSSLSSPSGTGAGGKKSKQGWNSSTNNEAAKKPNPERTQRRSARGSVPSHVVRPRTPIHETKGNKVSYLPDEKVYVRIEVGSDVKPFYYPKERWDCASPEEKKRIQRSFNKSLEVGQKKKKSFGPNVRGMLAKFSTGSASMGSTSSSSGDDTLEKWNLLVGKLLAKDALAKQSTGSGSDGDDELLSKIISINSTLREQISSASPLSSLNLNIDHFVDPVADQELHRELSLVDSTLRHTLASLPSSPASRLSPLSVTQGQVQGRLMQRPESVSRPLSPLFRKVRCDEISSSAVMSTPSEIEEVLESLVRDVEINHSYSDNLVNDSPLPQPTSDQNGSSNPNRLNAIFRPIFSSAETTAEIDVRVQEDGAARAGSPKAPTRPSSAGSTIDGDLFESAQSEFDDDRSESSASEKSYKSANQSSGASSPTPSEIGSSLFPSVSVLLPSVLAGAAPGNVGDKKSDSDLEAAEYRQFQAEIKAFSDRVNKLSENLVSSLSPSSPSRLSPLSVTQVQGPMQRLESVSPPLSPLFGASSEAISTRLDLLSPGASSPLALPSGGSSRSSSSHTPSEIEEVKGVLERRVTAVANPEHAESSSALVNLVSLSRRLFEEDSDDEAGGAGQFFDRPNHGDEEGVLVGGSAIYHGNSLDLASEPSSPLHGNGTQDVIAPPSMTLNEFVGHVQENADSDLELRSPSSVAPGVTPVVANLGFWGMFRRRIVNLFSGSPSPRRPDASVEMSESPVGNRSTTPPP